MLCEQCKKRPATVHITKIVNGEKAESHLCEVCAREKGEFGYLMEPSFSIHNLLAGLLHYEGAKPGVVEKGVRCSQCGLTYQEFTRTGLLGCRHCYEDFAEQLEPLFRRIHGYTVHTGKAPRRTAGKLNRRRKAEALRRELEEAVANEEFERAAELRDQIRALEARSGEGEA